MKHLPSTVLKRHEYERVTWDVTVPFGVSFDDLLDAPLWAHHAGSIRRGHLVFVIAADLSFTGMLLATDVDVGYVKMRVVWKDLDEARAAANEASLASNAEAAKRYADAPKSFPCVDFKPATGWRLIGHDGKEVGRYASEPKAQEALADYLKRSKAPAKAA